MQCNCINLLYGSSRYRIREHSSEKIVCVKPKTCSVAALQQNHVKIVLIRFRMESHRIGNELGNLGRYNNVPKNMIVCRLCRTGTVKDQYHFNLVCPTLTDISKQYFATG